ncbi:glycosyltransferase family 39 protein [Anatilimnocola floriformis]|uniref:glycosyltransferase family 39 protein n=1 Tax=Anatilimnocola floriformis TaxID=2948575 RepID=UPI0020C38996|nr:glycosyltransferase family 39 protein [Anatilimnocola floriformis]
MPRKPTIIVLSAIVVLTVILRGWQLGESLWLDELHTSWTVSGSLSDVAQRAAVGNQSPVYFWLTWFSARLPLPGEIALRLPSMLAGCALPVAVFWLCKKLLPKKGSESADDTVPLLAAALVAIAPRAIFYSQEARPYAILMLVAALHYGVLLKGLERATWQMRTYWVITGALLVHLHYTGGLILLAELVALLLLAISDVRQRSPSGADCSPFKMCTNCLVDIGALVVLLLPAIPGMLAVSARRENWSHFVEPQPWEAILLLFPWTTAVVVLIVLKWWRPVLQQPSLILLACWIFVPQITAWLTTQVDVARLFHSRYLIAVMPATLIAAALCVRLCGNAATQSIAAGIILAIAFATSGIMHNWRQDGKVLHDRREDWRGAVAALNDKLKNDSATNPPILVRSGLIEADALRDNGEPFFRDYCLCPVKGIYRLNSDNLIPLTTDEPGLLQAELSERLRSEDSLWLLVRTSQASVREQLLKDLKKSLGVEIEASEPQFFGNLYLQQIKLRQLPVRR